MTLAVACAVTVGSLWPRAGEAQGRPQDAAVQPSGAQVNGRGNGPGSGRSTSQSINQSNSPSGRQISIKSSLKGSALPHAAASAARQARRSRLARVSAPHVTAAQLVEVPADAPGSCKRPLHALHAGQSAGAAVAQAAQRLVGCPYRFGGASSSEGFDCSGLVWYVHHVLHMPIPRRAEDQSLYAAVVPEEQLRPGDLLFFHFADGDSWTGYLDYAPAYINHVGIYAGGGRFIHAPKEGKTVQYAKLQDFKPYFLKAGRYWSGSGLLARG